MFLKISRRGQWPGCSLPLVAGLAVDAPPIFANSSALYRQVMKVLGLIGTLDPYKHKVNLGNVEDGSIGSNERRIKKESGRFSSCCCV